MRIEVVGATGQLGRELVRVLADGPHRVSGHGRADVDIRDPESVSRLIERERPDVVINCAAWTGVDAAESEEAQAHAVNAVGAGNVAEICGRRDILLCHLSTDYVFSGRSNLPMDEQTPTNPLGAYARSKLAGEIAVREVSPRHQVVRTSWLYGQDGPNFVLTMLRLAGERSALRVVADQVGTPTWTGHLAPALARLIELGVTGTFHLTNSGVTSWHGFATAIMEEAGLDVSVAPITTSEFPTAAPRPAYSVLDNRAWRDLGEPALPSWRDGLHRYMAQLMAVKSRGQD